MQVDIDAILRKMDGWNLSLTIADNVSIIDAPAEDAYEKLRTILSADAVHPDVRPELEQAIAPLIREKTIDVKSLRMEHLVGAATAIVIHANDIRIAHAQGVCRAVAEAMKAAQSSGHKPAPQPAPDAIRDNSSGDHPKGDV